MGTAMVSVPRLLWTVQHWTRECSHLCHSSGHTQKQDPGALACRCSNKYLWQAACWLYHLGHWRSKGHRAGSWMYQCRTESKGRRACVRVGRRDPIWAGSREPGSGFPGIFSWELTRAPQEHLNPFWGPVPQAQSPPSTATVETKLSTHTHTHTNTYTHTAASQPQHLLFVVLVFRGTFQLFFKVVVLVLQYHQHPH